jgi:thermostable 8-oxoguanine DNA glycosylase
VTVYHLAKNIGLQFAKPDRHLVSISNKAGYQDVQAFCRDISNQVGDSITVVDLVLWRFATLEKNYEMIFDIDSLFVL